MIYIDLIYSLALLITLSVLSGMIKCRQTDWPYYKSLWQGLLFGSITLTGMLNPLVLQPGLFFDGYSVVISLCGLFFGPLSVGIASSMAIAFRVFQGGIGTLMGILVILFSAVIGLLTQRYLKNHREFSIPHLWFFGLLVHTFMLLATLALPSDLILSTLKTISLPVIIFYPIATVIAGKIILDQLARSRLINELMASEEELSTTLYSLGDAMISTDPEGFIRQINPEAEHLTGWNEADAKGKKLETVFQIINADTKKPAENPTQRVLRSGRAIGLSHSMVLLSKDGKQRPIADRAAPIRNSNGQVTGVVVIFRDQTRERTAEASLRDAERQWKNTFNATKDAICLLDENQRIVRCNQAMTLFCDIKESELVGKLCWTVVHKTSKPNPDCPIPKMMRSKQRERMDLQIGDNSYEVTADPLFDEVGDLCGAVHIIRDISARKKAEEALKRIEWMLTKNPTPRVYPSTEYGNLVDLNSDGLILQSVGREMLQHIAEDHMRLLDTSSAIYEADGRYAYEIFSSTWCSRLDQTSRALCNTPDNAAALASGKWLCHEDCWSACSKKAIDSGMPIDIECCGGIRLYAVPILANGKTVGAISFGYGDPPRDLEKLKRIANRYQTDVNALKFDADTYPSRPPYVIEMAKERVKTSAHIIGLLVEIKLAHQQQDALEKQLLQSQRMESIGRLAGGIAHDFNNILQIIMGRTEILLNTPALNPAQTDGLTEISKAALRSADLTQQLLAFASKQPITPQVLDVNESIEATLDRLHHIVGERAQLIWTPVKTPLQVKMDPAQLTQLLTRLTAHACDTIGPNGQISIETKKAVFDMDSLPKTKDFTPGNYSQITIRDNGKGMDQETCDRIFEPYFTPSTADETLPGLGLSMLYGIVRQNGGFIDVKSEVNQGSIFTIYIPLHVEKKKVRQRITPVYNIPRGTETILFVEDDENLLVLGRMQLEEMGYTVLSTHLAGSAESLSKDFPGTIDLLLTDVIMPEMNGVELSERILKQRPRIKRLFMSGYTADIMTSDGVVDASLNFLQKPFSAHDLAETLRDVLDASK